MSEYRIHPAFGILTDPEEIAIFDRQQAEKDMEKSYWEAQQLAEYEAEMDWVNYLFEQCYEYYWMFLMIENEMITD